MVEKELTKPMIFLTCDTVIYYLVRLCERAHARTYTHEHAAFHTLPRSGCRMFQSINVDCMQMDAKNLFELSTPIMLIIIVLMLCAKNRRRTPV